MPRRARPTERRRPPDRKYANATLQQFNNNVMRNGKRATAEGIVYGALTLAETSTRKPGIDVFETAMKNAMPLIEVKPRRVGGATYQVPVEIKRNSSGFQYQQQKYGKDELSRAVLLCAVHDHNQIPKNIDVIELAAMCAHLKTVQSDQR